MDSKVIIKRWWWIYHELTRILPQSNHNIGVGTSRIANGCSTPWYLYLYHLECLIAISLNIKFMINRWKNKGLKKWKKGLYGNGLD
jgi:hypothetical protein